MIRKLAAYALRLTAERLDPAGKHVVYVYGDTFADESPRERRELFRRAAGNALKGNN